MLFKDVLNFLFERAKEKEPDVIRNQDDFAKRHGLSREHMNQFLTGNKPVPDRTIWQILGTEGYKLNNCVRLPEMDALRSKHSPLFDNLEIILLSEDERRIDGIQINLEDIANGARAHKQKVMKVDNGAVVSIGDAVRKEDAGNIAPREKKKPSKRRGA